MRRGWVGAVLVAGSLLAAACSSGGSDGAASTTSSPAVDGATTPTTAADAGPAAIEVVSSRPDMVTGGQLLARVDAGSADDDITVDGKPAKVEDGPIDGTKLISDLPEGKSSLTVGSTTVAVVNHPETGPVFSGPHLPLLVCSTEDYGLGPATDEDCSAATKTETKKVGDTQVEAEVGVINRSVYFIDMPTKGWNGRLVYRFGGGCGTTFAQGSTLTNADEAGMLGAGYATATATFNTFQVQCNDVLSAETMMMVKERFIEEYGPPKFTIGEGASGGAIQQHLIVQNYPGLLDAVAAILPFPDAITTALSVTDCGLLAQYYSTDAGKGLTPGQRQAIEGFVSAGTCQFWRNTFLPGINPTVGCSPKIPATKIYDPKSNPDGLRCTLPDANINQLGVDPATGFARNPLDNVGIEYGRKALVAGDLSVDQFLDLNQAIGGYDDDGKVTPDRTKADEAALRITYAKGRVSVGGGDQKKIPIVDLDIYTDDSGDIHDRWRAFSLRARLQSDNFQIWTRASGDESFGTVVGNIATGGGQGQSVVAVLDQWLTEGKRPAGAEDNCIGADGKLIAAVGLYDSPGPCTDRFPIHLDPRQVAGAPIANEILKCQTTSADPGSYGDVSFTPDQVSRLKTVFPDGVCDWTKDGVGQVPLEGTWLRY